MDPLVAATTAFFAQVGGRHLVFSFTDVQKRLMQHPTTQLIILLALFFLTTRNLLVSTMLMVAYYMCVNVFFNENHPWNVLPRHWLQGSEFHARDPMQLYHENLSRLHAHKNESSE